MGLSSYLGPAATVFATIFAGTVGLWLGTRLNLGKFKHERAFDRRVNWYERMVQTTQQMRSIAWEVSSNLSKLSLKPYTELSDRAKQLAREFNDLADERHIYAKKAARAAIYDLTLTNFKLEGEVPGQGTGRRANNFWQNQHADWSKAHLIISEELQEVLFLKERRFFAFGLGRPNVVRSAVRKNVPPNQPRFYQRWLGRAKANAQPSERPTTGPTMEASSTDVTEDLDEAGVRALFDSLWATMQIRTQLEENGNLQRVAILNVVQCALLRVADLRSLLSLLEGLRHGKRSIEGWQRQHLARLLSLTLVENTEQFHYLLSAELRESVAEIGGSEVVRQYDELVRDLQNFRGENNIKLQPFRNSITSQRYANANLHIQSLRAVQREEIERLGLDQLNWITRLLNVATAIWKAQP